MHALVQSATVVTLFAIFWQDYKERAVRWILFPILGALFLFENLYFHPNPDLLYNIGITAVFVALQVSLLSLYLAYKEKKIVNLFQGYLGLGDVLFWLALCFLFTPAQFILFYLASMGFVLFIVVITRLFFTYTIPTIPLAGLQALFLIILMIVNGLIGKYSFQNDEYILRLLSYE